jgi:hypothetical protein
MLLDDANRAAANSVGKLSDGRGRDWSRVGEPGRVGGRVEGRELGRDLDVQLEKGMVGDPYSLFIATKALLARTSVDERCRYTKEWKT